jgi:hypothetical protein
MTVPEKTSSSRTFRSVSQCVLGFVALQGATGCLLQGLMEHGIDECPLQSGLKTGKSLVATVTAVHEREGYAICQNFLPEGAALIWEWRRNSRCPDGGAAFHFDAPEFEIYFEEGRREIEPGRVNFRESATFDFSCKIDELSVELDYKEKSLSGVKQTKGTVLFSMTWDDSDLSGESPCNEATIGPNPSISGECGLELDVDLVVSNLSAEN